MKIGSFLFLIGVGIFLSWTPKEIITKNIISACKIISLDTIIIENSNISTGSKIMTDQDALVVFVDSSIYLSSIELYFSNVSTLQSDSSRLFIKSQRSWSCSPLGNANPLQVDQYTLGITNNSKVKIGWNTYLLEPPVKIDTDTIYIWPDLIQQVQPRVVYASGSNTSIGNLTNFLCANPSNSISSLDYACRLTFIQTPTCTPYLEVLDDVLNCYSADTIISKAQIAPMKSITYHSKNIVSLDTTFCITKSAQFTIDMTACKN